MKLEVNQLRFQNLMFLCNIFISLTEVSSYVSWAFLGNSTHMDLFKNFANASDIMFEGKLIQVSMGGPSVNLKFYNDMTNDRSEKGLTWHVSMGTCGIHTTLGAFKIGTEKLKSIMKESFNILHNSLVGREDYEVLLVCCQRRASNCKTLFFPALCCHFQDVSYG